jgi:Ubiquitin 3 binding protein But2 C-terminal domain
MPPNNLAHCGMHEDPNKVESELSPGVYGTTLAQDKNSFPPQAAYNPPLEFRSLVCIYSCTSRQFNKVVPLSQDSLIMKGFLAVAALVGIVAAYPGKVTKRELTEKDIDARTGCPRTLTPGEYEFPHYITQISEKHPNKAFGPSYDGVFTPNDVKVSSSKFFRNASTDQDSSIFMFDIPESRTTANCTLEFIFPKKNQLKTSSFSYSGGGSFFWTGYNPGSCPNASTTYNNQPAPGPFPAFPPVHMEPGNAYTIDIGPCFVSAGTCVAGKTSTNDTHFTFFQDSAQTGECPIGVYTAYSYI